MDPGLGACTDDAPLARVGHTRVLGIARRSTFVRVRPPCETASGPLERRLDSREHLDHGGHSINAARSGHGFARAQRIGPRLSNRTAALAWPEATGLA